MGREGAARFSPTTDAGRIMHENMCCSGIGDTNVITALAYNTRRVFSRSSWKWSLTQVHLLYISCLAAERIARTCLKDCLQSEGTDLGCERQASGEHLTVIWQTQRLVILPISLKVAGSKRLILSFPSGVGSVFKHVCAVTVETFFSWSISK